MPILKNAIKKMRQDVKKTMANTAQETNLRTSLAKARKSGTVTDFQKAASALDRAAKKNVIHPNKAARQKSRLAKLLKELKPEIKPVAVSRKPKPKLKK